MSEFTTTRGGYIDLTDIALVCLVAYLVYLLTRVNPLRVKVAAPPAENITPLRRAG